MKGLKVNAVMPWEVGLLLILIGIILVFLGIRQSKKKEFDFNKIPITRPATKILFGSSFILIGFIQLMPIIFNSY